jgi:hypothetical protein
MPPLTHYDHKDTIKYVPKHHKTKGLTPTQIDVFKALEKRYVHEGRTIDPSFIEGTNLLMELATINFDCLLEIDEPICPSFILEFYASVTLSTDEYGRMSINFRASSHQYSFTLEEFAQILGVPNHGTCIYSEKHSLSTLDTLIDRIHPYDTPLVSKDELRDHLFIRTTNTRRIRTRNEVNKDPYGMELNELKPQFKKWEELLRANVISTIGNRDHINVCLCYMLYSLSVRQPFNLAYYMAKRMADIPVQGTTTMPYGMLLTRLFRFISLIPATPTGLRLDYSLIPHTFVPLSDRRVYKAQGKRPHPPTSSSSSSMSEDETLPNSRLPPLEYLSQLPDIPNESAEFKQTKGMFKNIGRFLGKLKKKIDHQ